MNPSGHKLSGSFAMLYHVVIQLKDRKFVYTIESRCFPIMLSVPWPRLRHPTLDSKALCLERIVSIQETQAISML